MVGGLDERKKYLGLVVVFLDVLCCIVRKKEKINKKKKKKRGLILSRGY